MQPDRETEALLYWVRSASISPTRDYELTSARSEYRRTLERTDISPPAVGDIFETAIPGPGGSLRLRWYRPAPGPDDRPGPRPAILFMHGGGCVVGSIDTHDTLARTLCHDTRATVISLDYRLAPEHPFPAAVEDTVAALAWLAREAPRHGLDPMRLAVIGDSAGAGLSAVAVNENRGRLAGEVRAQVLIYPALDLKGRLPSRRIHAATFPLPATMIEWFHMQYFGLAWPITDPRAAPLLYADYTGLPPALIVTAGLDPLRDEAFEYGAHLARAGVPVEHLDCEGTIHGFMNMGRILRSAHRRARKRIAEFLVERLWE